MNIKQIRHTLTARGWTQKQLAQMLHIHPVTLGLILIGKNKLTPQLASHMELLFQQTEVHEPPRYLNDTTSLPLLLCILQALIRNKAPHYTQEQQEKINTLADAFAQLADEVRNAPTSPAPQATPER